MTPQEQFQALNVLEYVSDLFTGSPRESFTKVEILVILNRIKTDPELFDPDVVEAHSEVVREIG